MRLGQIGAQPAAVRDPQAPKAQLPYGRLWVSDGGGLRSYLPEAHSMTPQMTAVSER